MLYDIAFAIFAIFYVPTLIFKGKLHGSFAERFGCYPKEKAEALDRAQHVIWIQAVSVGEVALCKSLVPMLRERFPWSAIVFSTITKTGNDLAQKLYSKDAIVIYFPLDLSFIARKVVKLIDPKLYIMVETEIWPNVIKEVSKKGAPVVMLNGRISDRSFGKYRLAKPFLKGTLASIQAFCMQSQTDADRIIELGAPKERVSVTGSMKFDMRVETAADAGERVKKLFGLLPDEGLFVAGSTHKGEEEVVLSVFKKLKKEFPSLRLLIAPRHIDRSGDVIGMAKSLGFDAVRVSDLGKAQSTVAGKRPVFILDTIGQLSDIFSVATIVFIGGSLIEHGGQNPIEPAAFGKPVLFGPHMFNFREIVKTLLDNDGAIQVKSGDDLFMWAASLLRDRSRMSGIGENARHAVISCRGATIRNVEVIKRLI